MKPASTSEAPSGPARVARGGEGALRFERGMTSPEDRLAQALDATNTSMWDANPDSGRIYLDRRWAQMRGLAVAESEMTVNDLAALVPPEEAAKVMAAMVATIRGEVPEYRVEHRIRHAQGHWIWIESRGRVVARNADGRAIRMIGTNTDITARKSGELAAQEALARLADAQTRLHMASWEANLDTGESRCSPLFHEIFGLPPGLPVAMATVFHTAVHADDLPILLECERRAAATGTHDAVFRIMRPDGTIRHIHKLAHVVSGRDGLGTWLVGTVQDVTEREETRHELDRTRALVEALIENLPAPVSLKSAVDGRYERFNRAAELLIGVRRDDLVGHTDEELFPESYVAGFRSLDRKALDAPPGKPVVEEVTLESEGQVRHTLDSKVVLRDGHGRPSHILGVSMDITDRKVAEAELRASEDRLRAAQRIARLGDWVADLGTGAMDWSDILYDIYGRSRSSYRPTLQSYHAEIVHPDDSELVRAAFLKALSGERCTIDHRFRRPDQAVGWIQLAIVAENDSRGVPVRTRGTAIDITDRKRAEVALAQANETLEQRVGQRTAELAEAELFNRLTLDALDTQMAVLDEAGAIIATNAAWRTFDQIAPAACWRKGLPAQDYIGGCERARGEGAADALRIAEGMRDVAAGHSDRFELEYPDTSGPVTRWFMCRVNRFNSNNALRLVVTYDDMTSLHQARNQAESTRRHLDTILATVAQAVALYDAGDRLLFFNQRFVDQYAGLEKMLEVGVTFEEALRSVVARGLIAAANADPETFIAERIAAHRRADGVPILRDLDDGRTISITEFRTHEGGTVSVGSDVTELLRGQRLLRESQKLEALGTLTGGMAHDFNNYLGVIFANLDLALVNRSLTPDLKRYVQAALRGAERGAELTRSLLAFARRQPLAPKLIDVGSSVGETMKLLARTLGATIRVTLSAEPGPLCVMADESQLASAIVNLANNARDAMAGAGDLAVSVRGIAAGTGGHARLAPGQDYVEIAVADTGGGMSREHLERVFEPFFTTKPSGKGTGLGLSMVHGFVTQSGGEVHIDSEVGHGTTVRIFLPRVAASADVGATPQAVRAAPAGRRLRVLVAEDNAEMRQAAVAQLQGLGFETVEAENAERALALIDAGGRFDLLFSDVVMPGSMNGIALADEATRRRPGLKVLLASGYPGGSGEFSGKAPERYRLLSKPYRQSELGEALRAVLNIVESA
jgi:PAS domain S-box-containing protein